MRGQTFFRRIFPTSGGVPVLLKLLPRGHLLRDTGCRSSTGCATLTAADVSELTKSLRPAGQGPDLFCHIFPVSSGVPAVYSTVTVTAGAAAVQAAAAAVMAEAVAAVASEGVAHIHVIYYGG